MNVELFRLTDRIGTAKPGKDADLVLVRGDPLERIETIAEPDGVTLVLQRGEVVATTRAELQHLPETRLRVRRRTPRDLLRPELLWSRL